MSAASPLASLRALAGILGARAPRWIDRYIAVLEAAPASEHDRLGAAIALTRPALRPIMPQYDGPLCPAYPRLAPATAVAIAIDGRRPTDILPGLSAREAHEALTAGVVDVTRWILRELPEGRRHARHIDVARWLAAAWADPPRREALERERAVPGPGGAIIRGRYLDRVDELVSADLDAGVRTSVDRAFRAAAERMWAQWSGAHEKDETQLAPPPRWVAVLPRCARLLNSPAALVAEGREQSHCVGQYVGAVQHGRSVILSIAVRHRDGVDRSTAELGPDGRVHQHRAAGNRTPGPWATAALRVIERRIGGSR